MVAKLSLEETLVLGSKNNLTANVNETNKSLVVRGVTSKSEVEDCKKKQ